MEFPPKLFEIKLPFKSYQLVWEPGKGWRKKVESSTTIEFPPRPIIFKFKGKSQKEVK